MRRQRPAKKHTPVDKSVLTFGEPQRIRSQSYRNSAAIRECMAFAAIGRVAEPGSVVLAHIRVNNAGTSLKPGDDESLFLCAKHHADFDASPDRAVWILRHIVLPQRRAAYVTWQQAKHAVKGVTA